MDDRADVVAGNVYDKYHTRNPIARVLVGRFLATVKRFYAAAGADTVLEVGCGEGHLLDILTRTQPPRRAVGTDLSPDIIRDARDRHGDRLHFVPASAYALPFAGASFDLVVACEIIEHLDAPELALDEVARVCRREAIITVPREPLWRALNVLRGRYVRNLGNTPGHVQHFSRRSIRALVERRFDVVDIASPVPWTALRARVRHRA